MQLASMRYTNLMAPALCLVLFGCATRDGSIFSLRGEQVLNARMFAWTSGCGAHCIINERRVRYSRARCRWTEQPDIAECHFLVKYEGHPAVPDRQLLRRNGISWIAFWPPGQ